MLIGALIATLGIVAAQTAMLFWAFKRMNSATDDHAKALKNMTVISRQLDSEKVASSDLHKALTLLQAEKERLLFTIDTLEDQRNALLEDALKAENPASVAIAVRDALERLRTVPK